MRSGGGCVQDKIPESFTLEVVKKEASDAHPGESRRPAQLDQKMTSLRRDRPAEVK